MDIYKRRNARNNLPSIVQWHSEHLEYEGQALRYEDAETFNFAMSHRVATTNFVWKTYDALIYEINVNDIRIARGHEAYKRWSTEAKEIAAEIQREYAEIVSRAYETIVPVIFTKAATELMRTGSYQLFALTFKANGTLACGKKEYDARSVDAAVRNGSVYLYARPQGGVSGKAKCFYDLPLGFDNACLIEPLLNLLKS